MTDTSAEPVAAPGRIWIEDDDTCPYYYVQGEDRPDNCIAYVRADVADRLRAVLGRIETASRHWADYNAAPDAVHYAHESTARLARAALAEGGPMTDDLDLSPESVERPSMAGAIKPLRWVDDTESKCIRAYAPALGGKMIVVEIDPGSGEYSAGIDMSGLCFRLILDTYHDGFRAYTAPAKFPSIEAAKASAQADYEARVSSCLSGPISGDALVSFARPFADALDIECDFMTPPAPFEDGFDVRARARTALAEGGTDEG